MYILFFNRALGWSSIPIARQLSSTDDVRRIVDGFLPSFFFSFSLARASALLSAEYSYCTRYFCSVPGGIFFRRTPHYYYSNSEKMQKMRVGSGSEDRTPILHTQKESGGGRYMKTF